MAVYTKSELTSHYSFCWTQRVCSDANVIWNEPVYPAIMHIWMYTSAGDYCQADPKLDLQKSSRNHFFTNSTAFWEWFGPRQMLIRLRLRLRTVPIQTRITVGNIEDARNTFSELSHDASKYHPARWRAVVDKARSHFDDAVILGLQPIILTLPQLWRTEASSCTGTLQNLRFTHRVESGLGVNSATDK